MSLFDTAAADLASILSDAVGGFAVPVTVVDPDQNQATVNGMVADIGLSVDANTGVAVAARKSSVTLPLSALREASLRAPEGVGDDQRRPWVVSFKMPGQTRARTFKVVETMPDQLGCIVCFLQAYVQ